MRDKDKSKEQCLFELQRLRQKFAAGGTGEEILNSENDLLPEVPLCRHEAESRSYSSKLLSVQEQERKRIAGELHDSLGSLLTAIKINLENARRLLTMGEADPAFLDNPIYLTRLAMQEVRSLIVDLRPSVLDDLGLIAAMTWLCRQMTICSNISVERTIEVEDSEIPNGLKIVIFRILQEAFHNIAKYSKTNRVELTFINDENALELTIKDHGVGFNVSHAIAEDNSDRGLGLTMMKERTELSAGSFSIISIDGKGTVIRASWPKGVQHTWHRDEPGKATLSL